METKSVDNEMGTRVQAMQEVIKKLRADDLKAGHCFMIFDDDLPEDQAYYEYPDGRIQIERIDVNNIDIPRTIIRLLTQKEIDEVKEKNEVYW